MPPQKTVRTTKRMLESPDCCLGPQNHQEMAERDAKRRARAYDRSRAPAMG
jgi:hypothetical protein